MYKYISMVTCRNQTSPYPSSPHTFRNYISHIGICVDAGLLFFARCKVTSLQIKVSVVVCCPARLVYSIASVALVPAVRPPLVEHTARSLGRICAICEFLAEWRCRQTHLIHARSRIQQGQQGTGKSTVHHRGGGWLLCNIVVWRLGRLHTERISNWNSTNHVPRLQKCLWVYYPCRLRFCSDGLTQETAGAVLMYRVFAVGYFNI